MSLQIGRRVRVPDGPFVDFIDGFDSIDGEQGTLQVMVSCFGGETPVALTVAQVRMVP